MTTTGRLLDTESAEFFLDNSVGDVIQAFESAFPKLKWWENMRPRLDPDVATSYESLVERELARCNLSWFR